MKNRFLALSLALSLTACATVPSGAPSYSRAANPPSPNANVYIYRIGAYPTLRTPTVTIDGKAIFDPPEKSYTFVTLAPGSHEFKIDWSWDTGWPDLAFPLVVEPSVPIYIKISGSFTPNGTHYTAGSVARAVQQPVAEQELSSCCRYVPHRP